MPVPQIDESKGLMDAKSDPANDFDVLDSYISDTLELPKRPRAIRIGNVSGGAEITLVNEKGDDVLIENVIAGETFRIRPKQIKATGTTVTNIVGYF